MKAQRKSFWVTLILSVIFLIAMVPLYLFTSEPEIISDLMKILLSGLSTGLLVSVIMSVVFHKNEKDQYMKKLYDKSRSAYYSFQKLTECIDQTLNCFDEKKLALDLAYNCKCVADNAFNAYNQSPLYSEEFAILFARKNKLTKIENLIIKVTSTLQLTGELSVEINRIWSTANSNEYKTESDKVNYIFAQFFDLKGKIVTISSNLDFHMSELEKKYKFDYSWHKTTKYIVDTMKNDTEQRRMQYRRTILTKINQQSGLSEYVGALINFLMGNEEAKDTIQAFGNELQNQFNASARIPQSSIEETGVDEKSVEQEV